MTIEDFVVIDFETATKSYNSACALGIIVCNHAEILTKEYFLIKPPQNYYSIYNTKIHGLTSCDTANAPTFEELWKRIKHYFNETVVFAHNAPFDISVLKSTLDYYGLEIPNFVYCDTRSFTGNGKLNELCNRNNVILDNHHNALCDAEAAARLLLLSLKSILISMVEYRSKPHNNIAIKKGNCSFKPIKYEILKK